MNIAHAYISNFLILAALLFQVPTFLWLFTFQQKSSPNANVSSLKTALPLPFLEIIENQKGVYFQIVCVVEISSATMDDGVQNSFKKEREDG